MLLYSKDIEILLECTSQFKWIRNLQKLPIVGQLLNTQVVDEHFSFREKLVHAHEHCICLTVEPEEAHVLSKIAQAGLTGTKTADGIFGNKEGSTPTVVLRKILVRLYEEYPELMEEA